MSKPNNHNHGSDNKHGIVKPSAPVAPGDVIDVCLVLKAINTMVSLKRERDYLRAECDRRDLTIRQLNNIIAEKDRVFNQAIIERDAWHKTAENIHSRCCREEARGDTNECRARFLATLFFVGAAIAGALVCLVRYGWR